MSSVLIQAGYKYKEPASVWCRQDYTGIAYNDGDEVELRIASIIDNATDISVLSDELRPHCTDWPSLYHLSNTRANILRPFEADLCGDVLEIGAGLGAITRYLGECGGNVLAVEGSLRRAAIARARTRDLNNVTVVSDKFDDFLCYKKFDIVTLIGVLEYANLFTTGENPTLTLLERARSFLKPKGKLIIAIENQLGLKYFAGAPEDHFGIPMYGIEGRYRKDQTQTFGRKQIAGLIKQAGFRSCEFLAPFPDYKLPLSIITERGFSCNTFDSSALACQSVLFDPQLPPIMNFSPELAWPTIVNNELALDLSNSFLIVTSPAEDEVLVSSSTLAWHYTTGRRKELCKSTEFTKVENNQIEVVYKRLDLRASNPVIGDLLQNHLPERAGYSHGNLLSQELIRVVVQEGWRIEDLCTLLRKWLNFIATLSTEQGQTVDISDPSSQLPSNFFDCIPSNIILANNGFLHVIDKEWIANEKLEVGYLTFRSLIFFFFSVRKFGSPEKKNIKTFHDMIIYTIKGLGWSIAEDKIESWITIENKFQSEVLVCPISIGNFKDALKRTFQIASLYQTLTQRTMENEQQATTINILNQTLTQKTEENEQQVTTIDTYKNEILNSKAILEKVYQSRSWRITQPLRNIILFRNKFYKLVNLNGISKLKNLGFKGIIRLCILFLKFITSGGFKNFKNRFLIYSEAQSSNRKLTNFWPNKKILMVDDSESNLIHDGDDIAVHLHAYYEEMYDEIIEYLNQIPFKFHLYITTDKKKKLTALKDKFLNLKNLKSSKFLLTPNKGRDIAPMIVSLGKELIEHDIVLHIHTKKSSHNIKLRGWRRYLLTSLLGNPFRIKSILNEFYKDENLGILFPVPFNPIRPSMDVGGNFLNMKNLLKREGKNKKINSVSMNYFPASSMFWFRGKAIKSLIDINLSYADFEEEKGQNDATLAHTIERLFVSFAESSFLTSKAYSTYEFDPDSGFSNIEWLNFYISNQTILNPVLIFDHDYGGGTHIYSNILVEKVIDEGDQVIRIVSKNSLWFIEWLKVDDAIVFATDKTSDLFQTISKINPSKIIINSFYGYFDVDKVIDEIIKFKRLTGIQLEIKAHDFYPLCPSPHLLDFNNKYCAVPIDLSVCNQCLKKNKAWYIDGCWPENIFKWRSTFSKLLHEATKIDFFDSSTVDIYKKIFNFSDEKISITPHNDNYFNATLYPDTSGKLHLGLLGTLTLVKGAEIVNELSSYIKKNRLNIPITLIGSSMHPLDQDVTVVGNYETSDLPRLVSEYKINVVFISSIVPETFSYTLSEAIKMKLPVICFDLGAQGNRVKNYDLGQVMPLNSTSKEILIAAQALLKKAQNKNDASLHVYN